MFDNLKNSISGMAGGALDGHIGKIQELAKQHLGPKLKELSQDEAKLKGGFKTVYPFLPAPVRMMVNEEKFVEFCFANKDKVLSGLV